jgi:LmbE family N-acetylglucosaminyl deacetylase
MNLSRSDSDAYAPDFSPPDAALARTTHLCVAAHADDVEIMAHAGIAECHGAADRFFTGVVVTDGAGSPRSGPYAGCTDAEMRRIRRAEQRKAAEIGKYNLQIQLAHPSADVKAPGHAGVAADLAAIFGGCSPSVVFLHNPADRHDTHVAVLLRCLDAIRSLPPGRRPGRVLGCEVWRDLDWLVASDRVALDAGGAPEIAGPLLAAFDSQIAGGKRYDLAALGRRAANATFDSSHRTDSMKAVTLAMDLTPLVADGAPSVRDFALGCVDRLRKDVAARLDRLGGGA